MVNAFHAWLKNLSKCLKGNKGYRLGDFVFEERDQSYIRTLRHYVRPQTPAINDLMQKVTRYAKFNNLI